jgi:hypothetical protein
MEEKEYPKGGKIPKASRSLSKRESLQRLKFHVCRGNCFVTPMQLEID